MTRPDQLIKELQALVGNPELNEIIDDKIMDAWLDGRNEESRIWVERCKKIFERQKHSMSDEEKERMDKGHFFHAGTDDDPECNYCGISSSEFYDWPQYCLTKEEKEA